MVSLVPLVGLCIGEIRLKTQGNQAEFIDIDLSNCVDYKESWECKDPVMF